MRDTVLFEKDRVNLMMNRKQYFISRKVISQVQRRLASYFSFKLKRQIGQLNGVIKAKSRTYCGYDKAHKDKYNVQKYKYKSGGIAAGKHISSKHSDTVETAGSERTKQKNENKSIRNIERQ